MALAVCLSAGQGLAQSSSDELARRHFDSGVAYLEESDYENALKAFEKAHELSQRPELLLNIATVHERLSDLQSAVGALQGYIEAAPEGEHVENVKLRIQNLEKRIQAQEAAKQPPPPAPAPAPAPARAPAPQPPQVPPPHPAAEPDRLPAFIALGVGGALGGGALFTGVLAQGKYDDAEASCSPSCSDGELSSSRGLAITSTVLSGAAALGVGLGVALLLTTEAERDSLGSRPRLDVALGPGAAAASASFRF